MQTDAPQGLDARRGMAKRNVLNRRRKMMTTPYTLVAGLAESIETPTEGTLSRTIFQDDRMKAVLFSFSAGQELSEHTASTPAVIHFLAGECDVTLGPDRVTAGAGTWIHMPPQLPHSIRAKTAAVMLLSLLKNPIRSS
jgi:quercetin dioxygenase-like cupin family protein